MATSDSSGSVASSFGNNLNALLNAMQQGVTAINNTTQTMKTIFPSS